MKTNIKMNSQGQCWFIIFIIKFNFTLALKAIAQHFQIIVPFDNNHLNHMQIKQYNLVCRLVHLSQHIH